MTMNDDDLKDKNGTVDVGKCEDDGHQNVEYADGHEYDGDSLTITGICQDCQTELVEVWEYRGKRMIHPDGTEVDDF